MLASNIRCAKDPKHTRPLSLVSFLELKSYSGNKPVFLLLKGGYIVKVIGFIEVVILLFLYPIPDVISV
jgi:hypothetical protein